MNIKVFTNISNEYQDIEIVINSPVKNEQVQRLENNLISESTKTIQKIIGTQGNDLFIINVLDIIMFYSEEKKDYIILKKCYQRMNL